MMLNNMRIGARLGLGFGALLLLLCAVAGIGSYETSVINDRVADLAGNWLPGVRVLGEIRAQANGIRRASLRHVLEAEKAGKELQASTHDELVNRKFPATLAAYSKLVDSPEEARFLERIKTGWETYLEQDKKLIELSNGGAASLDDAGKLATGLSATTFAAFLKPIEEDVEFQ